MRCPPIRLPAAATPLALVFLGACQNVELPTSTEMLYVSSVTGHVEGIVLSALSGPVVFTMPDDFANAIADLGNPTTIDFEDIDASPVNNTFLGRDPFQGNTYARNGISFSNPNMYPLYVSPGGLFWNESNSLSVRQFPFDTNEGDDTDDDLVVRLSPPAVAAGLTIVDNAGTLPGEFVQFIDIDGGVVAQIAFPGDFLPFRAFVGLVTVERPIAMINIVEASNDEDDINYDDFVFISRGKITVCHRPGTRSARTMELKPQALADHLTHGDRLGPCI